MKKQHLNRNILLGISFCIVLALTAMAFQDSAKINKQIPQALSDTPKKHTIDIEMNLDQLKDLNETLQKSLEIAEKSLKQINWNKISKEVELSMKNIDMDKLKMEIDNSMKGIDWDKMKSEIDRSLKEIDKNKLKMDIERSVSDAMKSINTAEMKKNLEEIKKINFDGLKKEMENLKREMELNKDHFKIDMEKAKLEVLKAKTALTEIKELSTEMEKDGLINKNESNTIEYKNKELLINGKKQSPEITEKYRRYFKGENFKFTLSNED